MSNHILTTGDLVDFIPTGGKPKLLTLNLLRGTSRVTIQGRSICVVDDEKSLVPSSSAYTSPPFTIPGMGEISIESLNSDQKAKRVKSAGKAVLLKGSTFNAKFQVTVSATQPSIPVPIPDSVPTYTGRGTFKTTNEKVKAT